MPHKNGYGSACHHHDGEITDEDEVITYSLPVSTPAAITSVFHVTSPPLLILILPP